MTKPEAVALLLVSCIFILDLVVSYVEIVQFGCVYLMFGLLIMTAFVMLQ